MKLSPLRTRVGVAVVVPTLLAAGAVALASSGVAGAAAPGQFTVSGSSIALTQPGDALLGRMTPAADADTKGMFGPQVGWPVIPVHASLLPNGNLVTYGSPLSEARQGGFTIDEWNPQLGMIDTAHSQVPSMASYDSFCSAMQILPDGRVIMVGGNSTMSTMYYDPGSKAESMGPSLALQRWYASVMRLQDDRILVLGGSDYYNTQAYTRPDDENGVALTPEIGDGSGNWTKLSGIRSTLAFGGKDNRYWYPRTFIAPDGNIFGISGDQMWKMSVANNGTLNGVGTTPSFGGVSGTAVMYEPGKLMLSGGGQAMNEDGRTATNATTLIDINGSSPVVTTAASMQSKRNWHGATILPNGEVFANGGTTVGTQGGAGNSMTTGEIWSPSTQQWRATATAKRTRTYHSTSVLMPSGSVFTGGGGVPGPEDNFNSEMYYPPNLFAKGSDGKVGWANRPLLTSISGDLTWGGSISLGTNDTRGIASVSLISAGNSTHSVNQDQRRIPLNFTRDGSKLNLSLPQSKNTVPPGTYLIQAVDSAGVPSPSQLVTFRNNAGGQVNVFPADQSAANGVGGAGPAVTGSVPLTVGTAVSMESVSWPGYRVRHGNYNVNLEKVDANSATIDKQDSTFIVRQGLASPTGFSFEAVNFPGFFIKNDNGRARLVKGDGSAGFAADATFLAVTGLTGQNTSLALFSDQSKFLRHQNFQFGFPTFNGERGDATLVVRPGLVATPTTTTPTTTTTAPPTTTVPPTTTTVAPTTTVPPTTTVAPTTTVPPTTTGPITVPLAVGTKVGLESVSWPGYLLRHNGFEAKLQPVNGASDAVAKADSTFVVRSGLASSSGVSFESVNFPGYFLRSENGKMWVRRNDGTSSFRSTSTFLPGTGLTGSNTSLRLFSDQRRYLTHANFLFYANRDNGSPFFKGDSTFIVRQGLG